LQIKHERRGCPKREWAASKKVNIIRG